MARSFFLHLYMLRVPMVIGATIGWFLPSAFGTLDVK